MAINWGDWQSMPDYRQFMDQRKGKSPIAQLARIADPTTHIPGLKEIANPIHDAATAGIETGNKVLSPVVKAAHGFTDAITPGLKQIRNQVPMMQNIHRFAETNPVDTAAIIVGSIFSGGALGGAMGGAGGAAGAGAAGAGAGAGAGTGASLGAVGGSAAGALQGGAFSGLGAGAGTGAMGAVGGSAAGALQGGAFSGIGAGANAGLLGSLKSAYAASAPYLNAYSTAKNLNSFAGPDIEKFGRQQQQIMLSERIRNDQTNPELPNAPTGIQQKRKRMIDAMMNQPQFFGRNY